MSQEYKYLTLDQVNFFMDHGFVVIKNAIKEEWIERATRDVWIRLGFDPNDKSTWTTERTHSPWHRRALAKDVAPAAWGAICEIMGGEERLADWCKEWRDELITNVGADRWETEDISPRELDNWHCDGDFFLHFLDSPEQGLLVIPLYSDIKARGGGTYIAEDSVGVIARWLRDHPNGIYPEDPEEGSDHDTFDFSARLNECSVFTEMTGDRGDVILLHPFILHSASKNHTRALRLITNPPIALEQPFNFNRSDPAEFSLVERKTLKELGVDRLDFIPGVRRQRLAPKREDDQTKLLARELERMKVHCAKTGIPIDSEHANVSPDKLRVSLLSPPMLQAK